jgi:hypothetical protein
MSWLFSREKPSAFHDKAWKRADLAIWDEHWHRLSRPARRYLLDSVRTVSHPAGALAINALASVPRPVFSELQAAGLVSVEEAGQPDCFVVTTAALGWLARLRALRRFSLLSEQPSQFDRYISHAFASFELGQVIADIVEKQTGIGRYRLAGDPFELFVRRQRWPEWVADYLAGPLARPLIEAIEKAGAPVPLPRLADLLPGADATAVRAALDGLVNHLALFEDLHPETLDIVVGLLPEVARARRKARLEPAPRLEPCQPADLAPEAGIEVPDLRTVLLEIAGARPRLRQDGSLFQKEQERFVAALDPLPAWLLSGSDEETRQQRMHTALRWAHQMQLVQAVKSPDRAVVLDLTQRGREWLALEREAQYAPLFEELREASQPRMYPGPADATFLGSAVHAVVARDDPRPALYTPFRPLPAEEKRPLREALYALFAGLPHGIFFPVDAFLHFAGHGPRNPLLLGRSPAEVVVRVDERLVPPLEEHLRDAARVLLHDFLACRLIGLGCVQMARDARGKPLLTCLPRLDAYFGKVTIAPTPAPAATRVVVQPDFTVVVIGLDPAPIADLAPFCDRVRGSATQGSLTFRLSRASLFRGLAGGLKHDDVLARLHKHASNDLPGNVLTEVQTWCCQARTVDVAPATLVTCPDADTAGRVVAVLGKRAQRVGERVVALDTEGITPGVRQKLQAEGILLGVVKGKK